MKFLADMGVSMRVVEWLRAEGHDSVHLRELGLQRLPDAAIFQIAAREQRVVVTFDLDFGEIIASTAGTLVSVVLFRLRNTRTDFVIRRLGVILEGCLLELSTGAIVIVEEARIRVRKLPIGA